jgi:hypothetical protein
MYALPAVIALALTMSSPTLSPGTAKGANASTSSQTVAGCHGLAWVGTIFYSDPQETQEVGSCAITCKQYVNGAYPDFGGGGTCSGTSGAYEYRGVMDCPCRN